MCGIAGFIGKINITEPQVNDTLSKMEYRGPDGNGVINIKTENNNIYLFHSRLSIIDLDPRSNQPMQMDNCSMVFNGEIYNYIEVRKELQKKGRKFITNSDSEVLLQAYLEYGEKCVEHFEGMWAFAIHDGRNNKLILSRDRFAEKPLFVYHNNDGIYFGSQTSFIKKLLNIPLKVNYDQICRYLKNGYKSLYKRKETYYEDVFEINYANNYVIDDSLNVKEYYYWEPKPSINYNLSLSDAIEGTRHHLFESLKIRLRSDVPMGFCLSGGIDSASITSIAAKEFNYDPTTFSIIDEDERYNELENIDATINDLGCTSNKIVLKPTKMLSRLQNLVGYHDAPVATMSYLVHSMLSEKMSEQGFKVAFSGTAADELFTGYYDHFNLHLYETRNSKSFNKYLSEWESGLGTFVRNPYLKQPKLYFEDQSIRKHIYLNNDVFESYLKQDFPEDFTEHHFQTDSLLQNRMLNELFHEGSRVILMQDDLNSMRCSIENRSPFLDTNLFDFAYSIPPEYLIQNGYGKYILRESLDGILNDHVRLDKKKKGFNASINSIIDFESTEDIDFLLADSPIFDIVKYESIEKILLKKEPLSNSFGKFLFNFINAKLFLELNN
jgi:asparagine synthase (glutamine-hydrolysing)